MKTEQLLSLIEMPVVTEKSTMGEGYSQYVFKTVPSATKQQIKQAIELAFGVHVVTVRTLNMKGKVKRTRFGLGKRKAWKKAIVSLQQGEMIDFIKLNN